MTYLQTASDQNVHESFKVVFGRDHELDCNTWNAPGYGVVHVIDGVHVPSEVYEHFFKRLSEPETIAHRVAREFGLRIESMKTTETLLLIELCVAGPKYPDIAIPIDHATRAGIEHALWCWRPSQ